MTVRVGVIGTGFWAREVHCAGLKTMPGAELVGLWGRDNVAAEEIGRHLEVRAFEDLEDLLGAAEAVSIAVAPMAQPELAIRAAEAGCHVLLEKPVALEQQAAWRVRDALRKSDRASIVFLTQRFLPEVGAWLRDVAAMGGWESGRVETLSSAMSTPTVYSGCRWRREKGALWDVGPHAVSMLLPVLGPVGEVVAMAGIRDEVHLVLRHEAGQASTISVSLTAPPEAMSDSAYFYGARGRQCKPQLHVDIDMLRTTYQLAFEALSWQVETGARSHPCDVELGCKIVDILSTAEHSLASGAAQAVPDGR